MKEKVCESCGEIYRGKTLGRLCQSCQVYFNDGGVVHPLPEKGVIALDEKGYVICHICGKAYKKLGGH